MAFVEELLVGLGFEFDGEDGERFINQTEVVSSAINRIAIAAGVAQTALLAMASSTAGTNDELVKSARALDDSAESIRGWQFAAQLAGVDGDSLLGTLQNLRLITQEAVRSGSGPFRAFSELGVDFQGIASGAVTVTDALDDIIATAQQLDRATAQAALRELGVDVRLLDTPIEDLRAFVEEGREFSGVNAELTDAAEDFQDAWARVQLRFGGITNQISADLLPVLTKLLNQASEFFEYLQTTGVPVLLQTVEAFGGWSTVLATLTAATGLPLVLGTLKGIATAGISLKGIFTAAATALGLLATATALGGAAVGGYLIGSEINDLLPPDQQDRAGEIAARFAALFGSEEATRALTIRQGYRPPNILDLFTSPTGELGGNPALSGGLRGQGAFPQRPQFGRSVTIQNTFMGVSAAEFNEIMRQQESQENEFMSNETSDGMVR